VRSASLNISQRGQSTFSVVRPTKTIWALRGLSTLGAPAAMRMIFQATDDFTRNPNNIVSPLNPIFQDVTWPAFASIGAAGNLATQNPQFVFNQDVFPTRIAANNGGVVLVDNSGGALSGCFVDVVRYGHL